ncbi:unnamed protein product [marine sediment metagenome]|uniref:Uncharacterized protein n=1 Tax=marine sediment metagenome TaxID=412755 RepID=X1VUU6_9ZZZZ
MKESEPIDMRKPRIMSEPTKKRNPGKASEPTDKRCNNARRKMS